MGGLAWARLTPCKTLPVFRIIVNRANELPAQLRDQFLEFVNDLSALTSQKLNIKVPQFQTKVLRSGPCRVSSGIRAPWLQQLAVYRLFKIYSM